jgi:hypothetical protein
LFSFFFFVNHGLCFDVRGRRQVTLLNDARLGAGKAPLGFLNQLLYSIARTQPDAFIDVTVGHNRCGCFLVWTSALTRVRVVCVQMRRARLAARVLRLWL